MMQVISISRGSLDRGKLLAELLANNLGHQCLSRGDLFEAAIREGIQVGKLAMAMLKAHAFTERLAAEREHYLAFCRAYLCERALDGKLVYHGRTHLSERAIPSSLRVPKIEWTGSPLFDATAFAAHCCARKLCPRRESISLGP